MLLPNATYDSFGRTKGCGWGRQGPDKRGGGGGGEGGWGWGGVRDNWVPNPPPAPAPPSRIEVMMPRRADTNQQHGRRTQQSRTSREDHL